MYSRDSDQTAADRKTNLRLLVIAGVGVVVYLLFCQLTGWMPKCLFHSLTGWNCPGCGMQRAVHLALHGQLLEAWRMNLILPPTLLYILTLLLLPLFGSSRLYRALSSSAACWTVLAVILLWWILRNLLHI